MSAVSLKRENEIEKCQDKWNGEYWGRGVVAEGLARSTSEYQRDGIYVRDVRKKVEGRVST